MLIFDGFGSLVLGEVSGGVYAKEGEDVVADRDVVGLGLRVDSVEDLGVDLFFSEGVQGEADRE